MKRKVIQIAGSTQLISLPRKWAQAHNVKKGEELEVQEDGSRIIVSTESLPQKSIITVDLSGLLPRLADRFLARAYQLGYDEINVKFDNLELSLALRNKVPELMGFEIFDQEHHSLLIKSIASKIEIDFESALRKAFLIALGMADAYLVAFKKNDKKELEALQYRDLELNRFCYFCLRAINKGQYQGFDSNILYYLIETLEDVGDAYKELGFALAKISPNDGFIKLLEKTNLILRLGYEFSYKPDKTTVIEAYNLIQESKKMILKIMGTVKGADEIKIVCMIDYILKLIYHYPTMRLDMLREITEKKQ
ncbi:phosphate uptake regulator PhoU [Candidatus Woesearchaeota archaeon]|nr:phosphate uptake regulator PhoU [Candidatus Woesearchaeota archaeon]